MLLHICPEQRFDRVKFLMYSNRKFECNNRSKLYSKKKLPANESNAPHSESFSQWRRHFMKFVRKIYNERKWIKKKLQKMCHLNLFRLRWVEPLWVAVKLFIKRLSDLGIMAVDIYAIWICVENAALVLEHTRRNIEQCTEHPYPIRKAWSARVCVCVRVRGSVRLKRFSIRFTFSISSYVCRNVSQ